MINLIKPLDCTVQKVYFGLDWSLFSVWIGAEYADDNKTNYLNNDFEFMQSRDRRGLAVRTSIYIVF